MMRAHKETRFWLASHISMERAVSDARQPFRKAKEIVGKKPKTVVTDGLRAYQKAFKISPDDTMITFNRGLGVRGKEAKPLLP